MNDFDARACKTCAFRGRSRSEDPCCRCYGLAAGGVYHPQHRPGSSTLAHLAGLTMARRP